MRPPWSAHCVHDSLRTRCPSGSWWWRSCPAIPWARCRRTGYGRITGIYIAARPALRRVGGGMVHGRLQPEQLRGFWAAWSGWVLDGMDSFIYALALAPALKELLPASGFSGSPDQVAFAGSVLFALFLIGWGLSFLWGPGADRIGRTRTLTAAIACYAVFTGATALAHDVWQFAIFRLLAGIGIGGDWSLAGTYVAESWPEDRRVRGAGYLQTGYYVGFFLAAALNYTVGAVYGWRDLFLCGGLPVLVAIYVVRSVREPERWRAPAESAPLRRILTGQFRRRTWINA